MLKLMLAHMVHVLVPPPPFARPCDREGVKQFSTLDVKTICERFNLWRQNTAWGGGGRRMTQRLSIY